MNSKRELTELIHRYADGVANAEEVELLNQFLRSDPQARSQFIEMLNLDSAIEAQCAAGSPEELMAQSPVISQKSRPVSGIWAAALFAMAASLLLIAFGLWPKAPAASYATVDDTAGAKQFASGMQLGGAEYTLDVGSVELITLLGARVAIEAPAQFYFESEQRLHLSRGRLAADVPPAAKGFTVVTPSGQVIDLGTKFGVDIPEQGEAEIHVFQGEVIAQADSGAEPKSLRDGEAFRMNSGAGSHRALRSAAFIRPGEVTALQAGLEAGQQTRSASILQQLRKDPDLVALLDFEQPMLGEGVYRKVQGRWPGSQAAEFVNVGDRMKLDVGGDTAWPQLTLGAWVRLDHLGEPYQSLLHTNGWEVAQGQVHWMVNDKTTMRLALSGNTLPPEVIVDDFYPDSQMPVLPEQGRWVHLAVVYDSEGKTVRFYFNGEFDNEVKLANAFPARLGPAQIGNWDEVDRKLSGRVDEMLILGRGMNDDEIKALFSAGNPYR